jgi:hypothetical protein
MTKYNLSIKFADTPLQDSDFLDNKKNIKDFSEKILKAVCEAFQIDCAGAAWQVQNRKVDNQGHFIPSDTQTGATWFWQTSNKNLGRMEISTDDLGPYDGGLVVFWYLYLTHLPDFECMLHVNTYGSEPMYLEIWKEYPYPMENIQKIIEIVEKTIKLSLL